MNKILFPFIIFILFGCSQTFEPELKGHRAYILPGRPLIHVDINGREKEIMIQGNEKSFYRFAQWTRYDNQILLTQITKAESCDNYQLISIDTTGAITDTIYTPPPNTALNFKLAPNDSVLFLKTYFYDCKESDDFKYTFYNRYSKKSLPDTIETGNTLGLLLNETIWSPDSKKVILTEWAGELVKAFAYNLATKDTTFIDRGRNFIWSPTDNDIVGYIKDYSIYTKNIKTGEEVIIFKGKKKRSATSFRWNPDGDFIMIHVRGYLLNMLAGPFQTNNIMYVSMKDKSESRIYHEDQRIDTWK